MKSASSGPGIALAAAALFGASTPIAKLLLAGIDPWLRARLLYASASVGMSAL
jgi:hypothetical protein